MDRLTWIQGKVELAFKKLMEQKCKDALNIAAAEPASWGSPMAVLKKIMPPVKKANETKTPFMIAMESVAEVSSPPMVIPEGRKGM
jgi:hypothetical protein